jgi:hypothetical protein
MLQYKFVCYVSGLFVKMDGWMEGGWEGWLGRWIDRWTDKQMRELADGQTDRQTVASG